MAASKEEAPPAEGEAVADDTASPDKPDIKERTAEASPTWMAPTDGFIWCVEALVAEAITSFADHAVMDPAALVLELKVKNPKTGEEEALEAHSLKAEIQVSISDTLFEDLADAFRNGTVRRVDDEELAGPSGPTNLQVSLRIRSTRPVNPALLNLPMGDVCAEERTYKRSKTFVLHGRYRRGFVPYAATMEFSLDPEENTTELDDLILRGAALRKRTSIKPLTEKTALPKGQ